MNETMIWPGKSGNKIIALPLFLCGLVNTCHNQLPIYPTSGGRVIKASKYIYNVILLLLRSFKKKCQNLKIKKINQNTQNESSPIILCFSHYKHHTDIKQPKLSTEIQLIWFFGQNQCFNILLIPDWTNLLLMHKIYLRRPAHSYSIHYFQMS